MANKLSRKQNSVAKNVSSTREDLAKVGLWKMANGAIIAIKNMGDTHVRNSARVKVRHLLKRACGGVFFETIVEDPNQFDLEFFVKLEARFAQFLAKDVVASVILAEAQERNLQASVSTRNL